jgi:polyisoprenoid-binding protein YceI
MSNVTAVLSNSQSLGVWNLIPEKSTIGFKAKSMWGLAPVKGRFTEFSGDGQVGEKQAVFGRVAIKAASVDTKHGKRDTHLRSPDFFEAETHPDINVVVDGVDGIGGDTVDLRAHLTVKTTTTPLSLRAKVTVIGDGAVRIGVQTTVDRQDFQVDGNVMGMIGAKVTVSADLLFRRTAS